MERTLTLGRFIPIVLFAIINFIADGLITTDVDLSKREVGVSVIDLVEDALVLGYQGRLLLWQNLSFSEFRIKEETKVIEI